MSTYRYVTETSYVTLFPQHHMEYCPVIPCSPNAQALLIRFVVDFLHSKSYNKPYNKSTANPQQIHNKSRTSPQHYDKSYNKPYNKSTTNRISGVWALIMRRLPTSILPSSVRPSCGHISKTKQDRLIVTTQRYTEVGTADAVAALRSSPYALTERFLVSNKNMSKH